MENRADFSLESNIQNWKSILTKKNNLTKSNIIELENHLLDLIDDLESKGLSKEESFLIAKKRIGKTDDICLEFDKVNNGFSFVNKAIPYLKGAMICVLFIILSKLFSVKALFLSQNSNIEITIIFVILFVFALISIFSIIYFNSKYSKQIINKLCNVNVLVTLIITSSVITYRLRGQIVLPGIDITQIGNPIANYFAMEFNFEIYKILSGFILMTTSLIFFWRHKKYNKVSTSYDDYKSRL